MGAPPCWTGYVWVNDAKSGGAVDRRRRLGEAPADRHSWRRPIRRRHRPARRVLHVVPRRRRRSAAPPAPDTPGLVGWRELHAGDGAAAFAFYSKLFGWTKRQGMEMGAAASTSSSASPAATATTAA